MSRGRVRVLVAVAAGALAVFLNSASAQQSGRSLAQVERERAAARAEADRLRDQASAARSEVAQLNARLVEAGRRRAQAEAAAADAELRLAALRTRVAAEGARYRRDRDSLESALMAAAFASRQGDLTSQRAGVFARAAAPGLMAGVRRSANAIEESRRLNEQIEAEQDMLADAQRAIDEERADVITLMAQRRAVEARLNTNAAAAERRVRQLAAQARDLQQLAQRVQRRSRTPAGPAPRGGDVLPASWLAPAEGRIARGYGERTGAGPATQGVTLSTRAGAQVVAPAAGEVAYAGVFRSYGQVLILNLDGGYAVVLTGLGNVRARVGDTVLAGQPIGEMADSDTSAPELYVEVRRDGRTINPARWLSARTAASSGAARAG